MNWNFDFHKAPRGKVVVKSFQTQKGTTTREVFIPEKILVAMHDGKTVQISRWIPDNGKGGGNRWLWFNQGKNPVSWQHIPDHPAGQST